MVSDKLVSADSHVVEPADLWLDYTAAEFRDRAPRVRRDESGSDWFYCEGQRLYAPGGFATAALLRDYDWTKPVYAEDLHPAGYDPGARLKEMDKDGVEVEVLYPSTIMRLFSLTDVPLKMACFQAYNSWLADFCSQFPDRYVGLAVVAYEDPEGAAAELRRARKLGLRGGLITVGSLDPLLYGTPDQDPLWAAAQDLDMSINMHGATAQKPLSYSVVEQVLTMDFQRSVANMIFSGVFARFPRLRLVSAENNVGWASYFLENMDHAYTESIGRARGEFAIKGKGVLPSEYFRRHVALTFVPHFKTDMEARHWVGVENIMWSNDFPHYNSTWPTSREILKELFAGIAQHEQDLMVADNARRVYGLPVPRPA